MKCKAYHSVLLQCTLKFDIIMNVVHIQLLYISAHEIFLIFYHFYLILFISSVIISARTRYSYWLKALRCVLRLMLWCVPAHWLTLLHNLLLPKKVLLPHIPTLSFCEGTIHITRTTHFILFSILVCLKLYRLVS